MKKLIPLAVFISALLLIQSNIFAAVGEDKIVFKLQSVQPYVAHFEMSAPTGYQLKVERMLVDGKVKFRDTFSVKPPSFQAGLYKMNGVFLFTLLVLEPDSKAWKRFKKIKVWDRSMPSKYRVFPHSQSDTVSINVDLLPSLMSFKCDNLSQNWTNVNPERGPNVPDQNQSILDRVSWHVTMASGQPQSNYYYVVISGLSNRPKISTVVQMKPDNRVALFYPSSATCISIPLAIDPQTWTWSSGDAHLFMNVITDTHDYQLNIILPQDATVTVSSCAGCLDH